MNQPGSNNIAASTITHQLGYDDETMDSSYCIEMTSLDVVDGAITAIQCFIITTQLEGDGINVV